MKTRDERANKYAKTRVDELTRFFAESEETIQILHDLTVQSHIAGAESEHAELTRWNDPYLKDAPKGNVLVKYIAVGNPATPYYTIGMRHLSGQWDCENELATANPRFEIIGWREIHQ